MKILLVNDEAVWREALRALLEREPDVEVVAETRSKRDASRLCKKLQPDVVIMDVTIPGGRGNGAKRRLIADMPGARVLALSANLEPHCVAHALASGVRGYIGKNCKAAELLQAARVLADGKTYLCSDAADAMARWLRASPDPQAPVLGRREIEVLVLLAQGNTSREIGTKLYIAKGTVIVHRRNIMRKLGLHSVAELTQYAMRQKLIATP